MSYYNTNRETGRCLQQSRFHAVSQETAILQFYQHHSLRAFSPSQLGRVFRDWPLTSIRRALSDLTAAGRLVKTNQLRAGLYGKQEHCWQLKETPLC